MSYQIGSLKTVVPRSLEPLTKDQVLESNGLPWLVQNPAGLFGNWQQRLQLTLKHIRSQRMLYTMWSQMIGRPQASQTRLQALADAEQARENLIGRVFDIFGWNMASAGIVAPVQPEAALDHSLHHFNVISRDWAWGENEINLQLEVLSQLAPTSKSKDATAVVVGAGGGRLAYELRRRKIFKEVIAFDTNPLNLITAKLICDGEKIDIPEFLACPISEDVSSIIHHCRAPEKVTDLHFAIGEAIHLPFPDESINWIITPFLLDTVAMHFEFVTHEFNRVLKMGGRWANLGSLEFKGDMRQHLVKAELREALHYHDFKTIVEAEAKMPVESSPASRRSTLESLDAWTVEKVGAPSPVREHVVAIGQKENPDAPHLDLNEVLALNQDILLKRMQFEIRLWVLNQIDGKATVQDIINRLSEQFGLNPKDSQDSVLSFLNSDVK